MPRSFFITVVYGTKTASSWSWPMPDWPLLRHHADDLERLVADADDLADRIDVRRRTADRARRVPSTATFAAVATSCGVKNAPSVDRPRPDERQVDVGALDLRVPVLVAGDDLRRAC